MINSFSDLAHWGKRKINALRFAYAVYSKTGSNVDMRVNIQDFDLAKIMRTFFHHAHMYDVCENVDLFPANVVMSGLQWALTYKHDVCILRMLQKSTGAWVADIDRATAQEIDAFLFPSNDPLFYNPIVETFLFPEHFSAEWVSKIFNGEFSSHFTCLASRLKEKIYSASFLQSRQNAQLALSFALFNEHVILVDLLDNADVQQHLKADHFKMLHDLWIAFDKATILPKIRYRLPLYVLSLPEKFLGLHPLNEPWMVHYFLEKDAVRLKALWENSFGFVKYHLRKYLKVYGLPLAQWGGSDPIHSEVIAQYVEAPEAVLRSLKFKKSEILAVALLKAYQDVAVYENAISPRSWQNVINADDASQAKRAKHFAGKIKPLLISEIKNKFGEHYVDAIEALIRGELLHVNARDAKIELQNAEKAVAEKKKQNQAITVAERKKIIHLENILASVRWVKRKGNENVYNMLVEGNNEDWMEKARTLFCSIDHDAQIAWRGYDPFAPVYSGEGSFPNLLTSQTSDNAAHTPIELSEHPLTEKAASEEAREVMAITYYALMLRKALSEQEREWRSTQIIARLAENRRANNEGTYMRYPANEDSPTCIVGIYNRAAKLWELDADLSEEISANRQIEKILRNIVVKHFEQKLNACVHQQDKTNLYHALIDLQKETALDYLQTSSHFKSDDEKQDDEQEQIQREQHMELRLNFIEEIGTVDKLFVIINKNLKNEKKPLISSEEKCYIQVMLSDIGGGWIAPSLTAKYQKHVPVVESNNAHASSNDVELDPALVPARNFIPQATRQLQQRRDLTANGNVLQQRLNDRDDPHENPTSLLGQLRRQCVIS